MSSIVIGSHTLLQNPMHMGVVKGDKHSATVKTYTSAANFNWGVSIVGKELELHWTYMASRDYDAVHALLSEEGTVVFDPKTADGKAYNVWLESLTGEYFIFLGTDPEEADRCGIYRENCYLRLTIASEVA